MAPGWEWPTEWPTCDEPPSRLRTALDVALVLLTILALPLVLLAGACLLVTRGTA